LSLPKLKPPALRTGAAACPLGDRVKMKLPRLFLISLIISVVALATGVIGFAAVFNPAAPVVCGTQVVIEADVTRQLENTPPTDDWVLYTRAGTPPTAGTFVAGPGDPPLGDGSFQAKTTTSAEKVFLFNYEHIGTKLSDIDDLSYTTYRTAGTGSQVTALNLQVDFNGAAAGGFTTLVFEPVYNLNQHPVTNGTWQEWIADGSGRWWSTSAINGQCATAAIACQRTWDQIVANNPDAVITGGVGLNQGSGNAGLISSVDSFTFDCVTYNFELVKDTDNDGIEDGTDNCPNVANADQTDSDGDGQGDACDADDDNDGVNDNVDNCPTAANPEQVDTDSDGLGNACDNDDDNDGVEDGADNCRLTSNPDQTNTDGDDLGNACDPDDDNDGIADETDNCPLVANANQANNDGDALGDVCDPDDDNDGVADGTDNCQFTSNPGQANNDGDALGDACDPDDDNDGILDETDNCDFTSNPDQQDTDGDGLGNACDNDDDNDGVLDGADACPGTPAGTQVGSTGCPLAVSKDQCKNGGWQTLFRADGTPFKNQGDCVSYTNNGK